MTSHLPSILLAVRQDMHRVWGRFDHGEPGITTEQLLFWLGLVAFVLLLMLVRRVVARRATRTFTPARPTKLFRELCAAHGLTFSARRTLKRLAAARGMINPAQLFVEPSRFETSDLPAELQSSAARIRQLRDALFT